uniref:Uncharacterized protein n=1 Tax=Anguilla anguilla TaxID=7936 RepID=A0A0E9QS00_ANGAN
MYQNSSNFVSSAKEQYK